MFVKVRIHFDFNIILRMYLKILPTPYFQYDDLGGIILYHPFQHCKVKNI